MNNLFKLYRNLSETSEELMNLFLNYSEIIELDLSNNVLTKLPLEISLLTNLTKLDIRNNAFSNVIYLFKNKIKLFFSSKKLLKF